MENVVKYTSQDNSLEIKLTYAQKANLKIYPGIGKSWPKQTQCILEINGLVKAVGTVVKHNSDPDNTEYAIMACTKKAFNGSNIPRGLREKIWVQVKELAKTIYLVQNI